MVVTTAVTADFALADSAAEAVAIAVAVTATVWQPSLRQLLLLLLRPSLGLRCDYGRLCSRHFDIAEDITVAISAADAVAVTVAVTAGVDAAVATAIPTALDVCHLRPLLRLRPFLWSPLRPSLRTMLWLTLRLKLWPSPWQPLYCMAAVATAIVTAMVASVARSSRYYFATSVTRDHCCDSAVLVITTEAVAVDISVAVAAASVSAVAVADTVAVCSHPYAATFASVAASVASAWPP